MCVLLCCCHLLFWLFMWVVEVKGTCQVTQRKTGRLSRFVGLGVGIGWGFNRLREGNDITIS